MGYGSSSHYGKANTGSGGSSGTIVDSVSVIVPFLNESNYEEIVVSDSKVNDTDVISCSFVGSEEIGIQGFACGIKSIQNGVGYTIFVGCSNGATCDVNVNVLIKRS